MITKVHRCTADLVKAYVKKSDEIYARYFYQEEIKQEGVLAEYAGSEAAALFNCGMAAITTTLKALDLSGPILASTLYSQSKKFFESLKEKGLLVQFINPAQYDILSTTSLIFLETIGNGFEMSVADIPTIMEMIKETDTILIVDNTFLTPCLFNPIEIAKEKRIESKVLMIESGTKYYQAGGDMITAGIVYGPKEKLKRIKELRAILGTYLQPTSLEHFPVEVSRIHQKVMPKHSENALKIAQYLEQHPKVEKVRYPLLKSHPQYELAKKLFPNGCGGVFYFSLKGGPKAVTRFADSLQYCKISGSFGFADTRILPLGALQDNGVLRIAAGFENIEKVIKDFKQALKNV